MRKLNKLLEPNELREMKDYWREKVIEKGTDYFKTKYRIPIVKETLKKETSNKCAYCESKIGHNCPGDVEHKIPVSVDETKRFEWENLTIACTECNRRKNDYYDEDSMFIDPYIHEVETMLLHLGPVVLHKPGEQLAEISVRILELNEIEKRPELFAQKVIMIKAAMHLMERIIYVQNPHLRKLLINDLLEMTDKNSEYSAMVQSLVESTHGPWSN